MTSRDKAEKELVARRKRLQADLKRFERRGRTARNRVEREVKKARTRVERELRQRRTRVERELRIDPQGRQRRRPTSLGARVENVVQTGITRGTQVATKVQERVAASRRTTSPPAATERPAGGALPASYLAGRSSTSPPSEAARLGGPFSSVAGPGGMASA